MIKRALFFVHYNKNNSLSDYVVYLLQQIKHIYSRIVFISNSGLSPVNLSKLEGLYNDIIIRENRGFDFGAWKEALLNEGWEKLLQYDNITLMNDSCFGPVFDLQDIYEKTEQKNVDFWGLTLHPYLKSGMPGTNGPIPEYIQSYFICFNKAVISSTVFQNFWINIKYQKNIHKVIQLYETKFTSLLSNCGFKFNAIYNPNSSLYIKNKDVATYRPNLIIENKIPFVKIKSFVFFTYQKYIIDLIQKETDYPVDLIYNYATEMFNPNFSFLICNKKCRRKRSPIR